MKLCVYNNPMFSKWIRTSVNAVDRYIMIYIYIYTTCYSWDEPPSLPDPSLLEGISCCFLNNKEFLALFASSYVYTREKFNAKTDCCPPTDPSSQGPLYSPVN